MNNKSRTCVGHRGEPLTEYASQHEAIQGAQYVRTEYGHDLEAYRCDHCRKWHLGPTGVRTPSSVCEYCSDSFGQLKDLYVSEQTARTRATIIREERGVRLKVYKCPTGKGWHLSKKR